MANNSNNNSHRHRHECETKTCSCVAAATRLDRLYCRGRVQQRPWLLALAGIDCVPADWSVLVIDDGLQKALKRSFENCGLGTDGQEVPALKGVDRVAGHHAHVCGLEIERLGTAPVESHNRIE